MKNVPNALTILRILLCIPLLLVEPLSMEFFIIYLTACATDAIDGPIARKYGASSRFGANLDGVADYILALAMVLSVYPILNITTLSLILIISIFVTKSISVAISYIRHKKAVMMHTYANKLSAVIVLAFPIWILFVYENHMILILAIFMHLTFIEEIAINLTLKKSAPNTKHIFEAIIARRSADKVIK